jgi:hypothetical protein
VTATALGSVDEARAGVASGVNNAVARVAGLIAIAVIPLAAGLSGDSSGSFTHGFHVAMLICAAAYVLGGLVALVGLHEDAPITSAP